MRLREASPTGHYRTAAFVTRLRGCGLEDVRRPEFAVSSEARALAELRIELGIRLYEAAIKIGVRAIDLSGLEHGRLVPSDLRDWASIMKRLKT